MRQIRNELTWRASPAAFITLVCWSQNFTVSCFRLLVLSSPDFLNPLFRSISGPIPSTAVCWWKGKVLHRTLKPLPLIQGASSADNENPHKRRLSQVSLFFFKSLAKGYMSYGRYVQLACCPRTKTGHTRKYAEFIWNYVKFSQMDHEWTTIKAQKYE